jgi:hypothetical protein
MELRPITKRQAKEFVALHHYARTTPSTVVTAYGLFVGEKMTGVALWGYGVRPVHTVRKLFPSLSTGDYLELNRFCLLDEMPRNSETQFLKLCVSRIREEFPRVRVLLSWADGLRGKPGYVYQAANWLYGGFIKSDFYFAGDGEVVHPRLLITRYGTRSVWQELGLSHAWGLQFRYCLFVCSNGERKRLLRESSFGWANNYPKHADLRFWIQKAGEVSREIQELPKLKGVGRFHGPAPTNVREMPLLDGLTA